MAEEPGQAGSAAASIDVAFGVVFAALAAGALLWLIPAQVSSSASGTDVAPSFMPRLSAGAVLLLSLGLVGHRLLRERPAGGGRAGVRLLGDVAGLSAGAVLVMTGLITLGFLPTAAGLIVAGGVIARHRPLHWLMVLAVVFPVLVDYAAWHVFFVDLP